MAYSKTTWVNDVAPPLSAANLNKMEAGIEAADIGLGTRPLVIERNETAGTWALRSTVTSDINAVVMWVGTEPAPITAGYAISGQDLRMWRPN